LSVLVGAVSVIVEASSLGKSPCEEGTQQRDFLPR
jgi:hypothetical protein